MWLVSIGKVINFRNFYFIICNFFKFKFDNYENRCFLVMKGVRVLWMIFFGRIEWFVYGCIGKLNGYLICFGFEWFLNVFVGNKLVSFYGYLFLKCIW